MAKKWKAYPWPDRSEEPSTSATAANDSRVEVIIDEEEEIDVVGDAPAGNSGSSSTSNNNNNNNTTQGAGKNTVQPTTSCWGPSSPTAGATAPSPPPHSPEATRGSTILYNGKSFLFIYFYLALINYLQTIFLLLSFWSIDFQMSSIEKGLCDIQVTRHFPGSLRNTKFS